MNFRENVRVEVLNCSKQDLIDDFEDSPEIPKSGLYRTVYSAEYGTFGGKPIGLMVANYDFGPGPQDIQLLQNVASVAAMAHAPFMANAGPEFFGEESYEALPKLKDLKSLFEGPQYARWHSFRESEDARYVGLCMPRFLLRLPYGQSTMPVKSFNFDEEVIGHHEHYLWGPASFAFATRVADSFAKYRWCPNIIGPAGRRRGRGPAAAPVQGHGRDPDQDPHRDPAHRAPGVRALGGGLHRAGVPQGLATTPRSSPRTPARRRRSSPTPPRARPRSSTTVWAPSSPTCSSSRGWPTTSR